MSRQFTDPKVQEAWERTGRLLKRRSSNHSYIAIHEMTLEQCLEAEKKYFAWINKHPDHEDRGEKEHLYVNYLQPRIEFLKANPPKKEDPTPIETDDTTVENVENDEKIHYAQMSIEEIRNIEKESSDWLKDHIYNKNTEEWQNRKKEYDIIVLWLNKKSDRLI